MTKSFALAALHSFIKTNLSPLLDQLLVNFDRPKIVGPLLSAARQLVSSVITRDQAVRLVEALIWEEAEHLIASYEFKLPQYQSPLLDVVEPTKPIRENLLSPRRVRKQRRLTIHAGVCLYVN